MGVKEERRRRRSEGGCRRRRTFTHCYTVGELLRPPLLHENLSVKFIFVHFPHYLSFLNVWVGCFSEATTSASPPRRLFAVNDNTGEPPLLRLPSAAERHLLFALRCFSLSVFVFFGETLTVRGSRHADQPPGQIGD
ncbi:hypothetical protein GOODEAATRI_014564 [Goodea atripinnis]|uniref:Uncharacterized protein n=1 Tax=Goodea atripinnis TaxID=208336 RepID=A0ABV0MS24_9TELE